MTIHTEGAGKCLSQIKSKKKCCAIYFDRPGGVTTAVCGLCTDSNEFLYKKALQSWVFVGHHPPSCTLTLITTGAFSQNVGKLFFKLKLATDNLSMCGPIGKWLANRQMLSRWHWKPCTLYILMYWSYNLTDNQYSVLLQLYSSQSWITASDF